MERNTKHQTPSSREIPESKHQKPSSKHQRKPKFQAPNRGPRFELGVWSFSGVWSLVFGVWDLVLLWSFEFGIWSLSPGLSASQKLICARARPGDRLRIERIRPAGKLRTLPAPRRLSAV